MPEVESGDLVVAVLTYKRPDDLPDVLPQLVAQLGTVDLETWLLVVDNDAAGSARETVERLGLPSTRYVCEPTPGIAAARNRALDEAEGARLLVFIDDDERPADGWLSALVECHRQERCAAVAGAVVPDVERVERPVDRRGRLLRPATTPDRDGAGGCQHREPADRPRRAPAAGRHPVRRGVRADRRVGHHVHPHDHRPWRSHRLVRRGSCHRPRPHGACDPAMGAAAALPQRQLVEPDLRPARERSAPADPDPPASQPRRCRPARRRGLAHRRRVPDALEAAPGPRQPHCGAWGWNGRWCLGWCLQRVRARPRPEASARTGIGRARLSSSPLVLWVRNPHAGHNCHVLACAVR